MSAEIRITIGEQTTDPEEQESMSLALRQEILASDVEDVRFVRAGPAPDGTRGVDVTAVNQLLVTVPASLTALTGLVGTIRSWLGRSNEGRTVEFTLGDQSLKLTRADTDEQRRLVEAFLKRVQSNTEGDSGA
jgi:Effector Associated Constant Component 1